MSPLGVFVQLWGKFVYNWTAFTSLGLCFLTSTSTLLWVWYYDYVVHTECLGHYVLFQVCLCWTWLSCLGSGDRGYLRGQCAGRPNTRGVIYQEFSHVQNEEQVHIFLRIFSFSYQIWGPNWRFLKYLGVHGFRKHPTVSNQEVNTKGKE